MKNGKTVFPEVFPQEFAYPDKMGNLIRDDEKRIETELLQPLMSCSQSEEERIDDTLSWLNYTESIRTNTSI